MRQGIYKDEDGVRSVDIQKALGKCYNNGWFTNTQDIRYILRKGSRNSKKSFNTANEVVMMMISDDVTNVLIIRKNDVDNRNSTFTNIQRAINDFGLEKEFTVNKTNMEITYRDGRKIIFKGLNNPTSLTSIQPAIGRLNVVWIEEAFEIESFEDFKKLDYSIRSAGMEYDKEGNLVEAHYTQRIIMTFNAWSSEHWLYTEFFHKAGFEDDVEYLEHHKYADFKDPNFVGPYGTGVYLHISTYKANEFRDRTQVDVAAAQLRQASYDEYTVLYLGCWGNATETTYPEFKNAINIVPPEVVAQMSFSGFAIGIDTGMSAGDGSKPKVLKTDDPSARVKAANTMVLAGITPGFKKIVALEEYFHSNNPRFVEFNTDNKNNLNINEQINAILATIVEWIDKYADSRKNLRNDVLMKGSINIYVDSADIMFRQLLQMTANNYRLPNGMLLGSRLRFFGSTKKEIWMRVQFERAMFGLGDMLYQDNCKNLIRETKNSRKGEKGEARVDGNDHTLNGFEYGFSPFVTSFALWKMFDKGGE